MVALADVRRWDPAGLENALRALSTARDRLIDLDDGIGFCATLDHWSGPTAQVAETHHDQLAERLRRLAAGTAALRPTVVTAADAVTALRRDVDAAVRLAADTGFAVGADATVSDIRSTVVATDQVEAYRAQRVAAQQEILTALGSVLTRATEIDTTFAALLARAAEEQVDDGDATTLAQAAATGEQAAALRLPSPPAGGTPAENAAYWDAIDAATQQRILAEHPELVGNLDGVPVVARDQANRAVLTGELARVDADLAAAQARWGAALAETDAVGSEGQGETRDQLLAREEVERLQARSTGLHALDARLQAAEPRPAFLMAFQPEVGNGRAAVAVGNPDTADNVVTYVPGTTARLDTIDGEIARADMTANAARNAASDESTAVIAWDGYEAPQSILPDAADSGYADEAEPLLRDFQDGLRASHDGPPSHNTILGHSYGTTVIGQTARDGRLDADALVFAGSPGSGVLHVSQLHRPDGTVYSTTADADPILWTHSPLLGYNADRLGADPSDPRFGAHVFRSNPEAGHSDYWREDNPSLKSFGRIATGQEPTQ